MNKRTKAKDRRPCTDCSAESERLFRVSSAGRDGWRLVCESCCERLKAADPSYRYGGTWTGRRRR